MKKLLLLASLPLYLLHGKALLFNTYPDLAESIPHIQFADLPTPVIEYPRLAHALNSDTRLYVKHDDLTGAVRNGKRLYGGNKVRKLEFLLADALGKNAKQVITFGAAGSNHATATAVYSNLCKLHCTNLLKPQINSATVQQNLLLSTYFNAQLQYFPDNSSRKIGALRNLLQSFQEDGVFAYMIPTGGSNPLGALGYVNAAFELSHQIQEGKLAQPDVVYVACGSLGTSAGLALGLQLAGLNTKIVAVATEPHDDHAAYYEELKTLYTQTNQLLHNHDDTVPLTDFPHDNVIINFNYTGADYGLATTAGLQAKQFFKEYAGVNLDNTYTSKAAAALVADAQAGILDHKTVIFWNTYCGLDFSELTQTVSYKDLPHCFHTYFE